MNDIPEIECQHEGIQFTFLCDRCGKKHRHGAGEGHRVAHCPHYPNGYILRGPTDANNR